MTGPVTRPLDGRRVVVLGAAGEVGEALVQQTMRAGATVVAVSRSAVRLEHLRARLRQDARLAATVDAALLPYVADVGSESDSVRLANELRDDGEPVDGVIASLGGWRQGAAVTATSLEAWTEVFDQSLTAHFLGARALMPVLRPGPFATYTFINGGAALAPVRGAGPMCVSAAAQLMLMRALAVEHPRTLLRINALVLATPVLTRSRPTGPAHWLTADGVGRYAAYLASSLSPAHGESIVLDHADAVRALPSAFRDDG